MEKINMSHFVRQISKKSGYAQKDINEVLKAASEIIGENISKETETVIMPGIIVYPGHYPAREGKDPNGNPIHFDEVIYPRARFTNSFKDKLLFS